MCFCRLRGMLRRWAVWWWGRMNGVERVNYKLMTFWLIARGWQVNRWSHSGPLLLMSRRVHYLNALVPWCRASGGPDAAVCRQWTTTVWDPFSLHHLWPKYDSSEILPPTLKMKLLFDLDYQGRQKKKKKNQKLLCECQRDFSFPPSLSGLQFCFVGLLNSTPASSITGVRDPAMPPCRLISLERCRCNHSNPSSCVCGSIWWNH